MLERRSPGRRRFDKLAVEQTLESTFVVSAEGVILDASASVFRLLGFEGEEILGMNFRDLLQPEEGEIAAGIIAKAVVRPRVKVVTKVRARRRDRELWIADLTCVNLLDDDSIRGLAMTLTDITHRKEVEEALRRSERHLRTILETALHAIVSVSLDGLVTGWDGAAEAVFGWSRDEAVGRAVSELLVPPERRAVFARRLEELRRTGKSSLVGRRIAAIAVHRDGSILHVELAAVRVPAPGGVTFTGFIRDISDRQKLEDRLRDQARPGGCHTLPRPDEPSDRIRRG
jgi:sigma-B regulation protein RsbU (phosphoserine phosphatase)